jgi:SAM-dependent methyltransferase
MTTEWGHLLRVARRSIKEHGIVVTLKESSGYLGRYRRIRKAWRHIDQEDPFDRMHGTDTTAFLQPEDFGTTSEHLQSAQYYRATPSRTFTRIMEGVDIRYEDFVFIDFGSGKGRTLLLASEYPFKRIVGVEFAPALHAIAQNNIRVYQSATQQCKHVASVCADATSYALPIDPTVYYFFDPFKLPVMSAVLDNIKQSLQKHPRKIFLIYVNPELASTLDQAGFLERMYDLEQNVQPNSPEHRLPLSWSIYIYTNSLYTSHSLSQKVPL